VRASRRREPSFRSTGSGPGGGVVFRRVPKLLVGILIAIAGVVACVLVAFADQLGIGHDGLGPKKDGLLGIGILLIIVGLAVVVHSRRSQEPLEDMQHMRG
jgi:hypothetical protein